MASPAVSADLPSHGCVRLSTGNAKTLFRLVEERQGLAGLQIRYDDHRSLIVAAAVAAQPKAQRPEPVPGLGGPAVNESAVERFANCVGDRGKELLARIRRVLPIVSISLPKHLFSSAFYSQLFALPDRWLSGAGVLGC